MEPNPDLLPKDLPDQLKTLLTECADLILLEIGYGTHLLNDALLEAEQGEPTDVVIMQVRSMLNIMDGVQILIRGGSVDNARLLVRTFVEQFIQYTYLIKDTTRERSLMYKYMNLRREWKWMKRMDPRTQEGKAFRSLLRRDPLFRDVELSSDSTDAVPEYEEKLSHGIFDKIREDFERQSGKKEPKHWYSLFDGPKDLEQLASRVNMTGSYGMFYRRFSEAAHGNDVLEKIGYDYEQQLLRIPQLRHFDQSSSNVLTLSLTLLLVLFKETLTTFKPSLLRSFGKWYIDEVQNRQASLLKKISSIKWSST